MAGSLAHAHAHPASGRQAPEQGRRACSLGRVDQGSLSLGSAAPRGTAACWNTESFRANSTQLRARSHTRAQGGGGGGGGAGGGGGGHVGGGGNWTGQLELSPETVPSSASALRSYREDAALSPVWRQLEMLEERLVGQGVKLQQHSERLVDSVAKPLEVKMVALESRHPAVESQLAELQGGVKGLQDAVEVQSQRTDAAEARFRRWRKVLEEEMEAKLLEFRRDVAQSVVPGIVQSAVRNHVSRQDLCAGMDTLRREVQGMLPTGVPCKETCNGMDELKRELQEVLLKKVSAASDKNAGTSHEEIAQVAGSLRSELRLLSEAAGKREPALLDLEKVRAQQEHALSDLKDRTACSEHALEDTQADLKRLQGELRRLKARDLNPDVQITPPEVERIAQHTFDQLWSERASRLQRSILEQVPGMVATATAGGSGSPGSWKEQSAAGGQVEVLMVEMSTLSLRLNTLQERQHRLQLKVNKELARQEMASEQFAHAEPIVEQGTACSDLRGWSWRAPGWEMTTMAAQDVSMDISPRGAAGGKEHDPGSWAMGWVSELRSKQAEDPACASRISTLPAVQFCSEAKAEAMPRLAMPVPACFQVPQVFPMTPSAKWTEGGNGPLS